MYKLCLTHEKEKLCQKIIYFLILIFGNSIIYKIQLVCNEVFVINILLELGELKFMKKNLLKIAVILTFLLVLTPGLIVFASGYERTWTSIVSATTPNFGGVTDVLSDHSGRWYNDSTASIWTTYQKTSLKHQIRLAYKNTSGGLSKASDWATAEVDTIKRPDITYFEMYRAYYSQAKSHNLEPTSNTLVKYKFASYSM